MKDNKVDIIVNVVTIIAGVVASGLFAKAAYHKGKLDGYNDIAEQKHELHKELENLAQKQVEA